MNRVLDRMKGGTSVSTDNMCQGHELVFYIGTALYQMNPAKHNDYTNLGNVIQGKINPNNNITN